MVDGLSSAGGLIKTGAGVLALQGENNTYTGPTVVNAGTLLVNGTMVSDVTVNSGATLGGSGTYSGLVTMASGARLSPGNSPGIQTNAGGLTLENGSALQFELAADTTADRGIAYDGINVTGGFLTIESGVTIDLVFNSAGSTTDFTSAFWDVDQSWLLFNNAAPATLDFAGVFSNITTTVDSLGNSFAATGGAFGFAVSGNDVYLSYSAVPEPSVYALLVGGCVLLYGLRRAKRS